MVSISETSSSHYGSGSSVCSCMCEALVTCCLYSFWQATQDKQTISIHLNGSNQQILGVAMDGTKLPYLIVFKCTETGYISCQFTVERLGYLWGQFYAVQDKAWVDTWVFLDWVIHVWAQYAGHFDDNTYLLMNEFSVYMISECV